MPAFHADAEIDHEAAGDDPRAAPAGAPRNPSRRQMKTALAGEAVRPAADVAGLVAAQVDYLEVTIDRVDPSPLNPRTQRPPEDIERYALSIAQKGLLQPIQTRVAAFPVTARTRFEVILGETRRQAILRAMDGIADAEGTIWTIPRDARFLVGARVCGDDDVVILAGVENFDRTAMPPLDEARLFAKVRPRVRPLPGKRAEDAIAALFHISPRTVFRRLALMRLAPELATAFAAGDLTLAQAEAFARGSPNDQRKHWKQVRGGADWQGDPGNISRAMLAAKIPFTHALFDPGRYAGEIVENEDGEPFFADAQEFARLQEAAIADQAAVLQTAWPWVEVLRNPGYDAYQSHGVRKTDKEAGAVIVVRGTRAEIVAPVLQKAAADRRQREKAAADRQKAKAAAAGADAAPSRPPLIEAQVRALHAAKTRAMRRAVTGHDTAALALACLGLLGEQEVRGLQGAVDWQARHGSDQYESNAHVQSVRARLALAVAAQLPEGKRPAKGSDLPSFERHWERKAADSAAWFRALVALPKPDLLDFFNHLLVERIGSWAGYNAQSAEIWLGDSPLAIAIAEVTDAEALLPLEWAPGEDYFKGYSADRLREFALSLPLYRDPSVKHVGSADPKKMKKGDLVRALLAQPAGTWAPPLFPECRFQTGREALKALAAPLPRQELKPDERETCPHDCIIDPPGLDCSECTKDRALPIEGETP